MARRASPQRTTDADRIDAFLRVGDAILARRALQSGFRASFSVDFQQGVGLRIRQDGPDHEDYRSLLLDLRKLITEDSPSHFPNVMQSAVVTFGDDGPQSHFEDLRAAWNSALSTSSVELRINGTTWKPRDLIHIWLNGEVFHDDVDKQKKWKWIVGVAGDMSQFIIQSTFISLVEIAMTAMARIDFLCGGTGLVSIAEGRVGHPA